MYMNFGQTETTKSPPDISPLLENEVDLNNRLDQLNMDLNNVFKRLINYLVNFIGKKTGSHKDWIDIGISIDKEPLTQEGQIKLQRRHKLFGDKVLPQPRNLAIAIIPIVVYLGAKAYVGGKLHERKIEGILKGKRDKRRVEQQLARRRKKDAKRPLT